MKIISLTLTIYISCMCYLTLPSLAFADTQNQGFSGLNHHIPLHARNAFYKYKAFQNRIVSESNEIYDKNKNRTWEANDIVGDCSISIGNINADTLFGNKENIVIIEGDVVNVGQCDQ